MQQLLCVFFGRDLFWPRSNRFWPRSVLNTVGLEDRVVDGVEGGKGKGGGAEGGGAKGGGQNFALFFASPDPLLVFFSPISEVFVELRWSCAFSF